MTLTKVQLKRFEELWEKFEDIMRINKDEPERMKPVLWTAINDEISLVRKEIIEECREALEEVKFNAYLTREIDRILNKL